MNAMHKAMFDFIGQYPRIGELFSFNFMELEQNTSAFRVVDEEVIREDILGNRTGLYKFSVVENKPFTTDAYSTENIEQLEALDDFIDWVKRQDKARNYPDIGAKRRIETITAKRSGSGIAGVDPLSRIAQYTFTVTVEYEELEE